MSSLLLTAMVLSGILSVAPDMDHSSPESDATARNSMPSAMPETKLPGTWQSSFEDAQRIAATQRVPLIVHFEAVWCGPCRQMESTVLQKTAVTRQLANSFVGVRINADQHSGLVSRFSVASLPTEIILDPEGKEIARFVGIATLDSYVARLENLATRGTSDSNETSIARSDSSPTEGEQLAGIQAKESEEQLRACLILQRDGKTVGLGGYSPVALMVGKIWEKGSDEFVAAFQGVEYFFRTDAERIQFLDSPARYIPSLHGCDPVELSRARRAEAGAIEYGAFYKGRVFFFTSLENRQQFQSNPDWYADVVSSDDVENSNRFPFLNNDSFE